MPARLAISRATSRHTPWQAGKPGEAEEENGRILAAEEEHTPAAVTLRPEAHQGAAWHGPARVGYEGSVLAARVLNLSGVPELRIGRLSGGHVRC